MPLSSLNGLLNSLQNERLLVLSFPNGDGPAAGLLIQQMQAEEYASKDFKLELDVFSDDATIPLKSLIGKLVTVELEKPDGSVRHFNGHVFAFKRLRSDNGFSFYRMEVGPWTRYLTHRHDNYVFQNQSCVDTLREIFADYGALPKVKFQAKGGDAPETYRVQWSESDYNYMHRRLEEKGWWYYFEHAADSHTLVICDDSTQAQPVDGEQAIAFQGGNMVAQQDAIKEWSPAREFAPTSVTLSSYDFKKPNFPPAGGGESSNQQGDVPDLEVYHYAGAYGMADSGVGDQHANHRVEALNAMAKHFAGESDCRQIQPGRSFQLTGHFDHGEDDASEGQFFVTDVEHTANNNYFDDSGETVYGNEFKAIRKTIPFRVPHGHNSQQPRIYGVQTGTVVGPAGDEIHCDEFGRVKVQFHWDRQGKRDAAACCWVRVATTWAGSNFGIISLPRIGQEVMVQWLDGNPDTPIITGSVYNQNNMPPWGLPDNKTQSGILTRSTLGGSEANANALRFEDKKGAEEVWLHAEKDQRIEVEHDESHWVGHDRVKNIDHDETVHVKHDRTETVDHDETITVHNNRTETVDHNETISIGDNQTIHVGKDRSKTVDHNETDHIGDNWSITVGKMKTETVKMAYMQNVILGRMENVGLGYDLNVGGIYMQVVGINKQTQVVMNYANNVGKTYSMAAGGEGGSTLKMDAESITLQIGKAMIAMKKSGEIEISGTKISIAGTDEVNLISPDINNN